MVDTEELRRVATSKLVVEAADEIERLRAEVERLQKSSGDAPWPCVEWPGMKYLL